jgi:protocatechuate 4,5-dioxygenase alpha chain
MARFQADPAAYCRDMPISAERQAQLVKPDIGALYLAGTNPYLLRAHCIGLRISEEAYLGALRAVDEEAANG